MFLPSDKIATIMLAIFALTAEQKLILIFDRTNCKFGKIHLNILFLSVIHNDISIPLFFHILDNKKQGNSSYIDRIKLLEKFIALLERSSIKAVLGDHEFAGKHWILWLKKMKVPFVMRISEKTTKKALENLEFFVKIKSFDDYLKFLQNAMSSPIPKEIAVKMHNVQENDLSNFAFMPLKLPES